MARILMLGSCGQSPLDDRRYLIRRLVEQNHRVVVVRPRGVADGGRADAPDAVHRETIPGRPGCFDPQRDTEKLRRLRRLFSRYDPDIFVGEGVEATVEGLVASWLAGVPVRWATLWAAGTAPGNRVVAASLLIQKTASMLYAVSGGRVENPDDEDGVLRCARRLVGEAEQIAVVEGSGVDPDAWGRASMPEEASFLLDAPLVRSRGVREYVEAARRIRTCHPSVRFRLAGWPSRGRAAIESDRLRKWIEGDVVEYLGHLEKPREAIADCSVYVSPPRQGGLSRRVLEAMAMGRPVVTTDVAGCRMAVDHGENGFVVDPGDTEGLARAMTHFVGEPKLREAMGYISRKIVATRFDAGGLAEALVESLELSTRRVSKPLLPTDV